MKRHIGGTDNFAVLVFRHLRKETLVHVERYSNILINMA